MKVPIYWLKKYVTTKATTSDIAKQLTSIGHMQDGPIQKNDKEEIIDLEVRQNRPDCLSIVGVARELAAVNNLKLQFPEIIKETCFKKIGDWRVTIENPKLCYRFNTIQVDNITVADSPKWLKQALLLSGMESINTVVDVTNFVMLELGQPLHAFDKNLLTGNIIIRSAKKNELFTALGNKKIRLTPDDLVIADTKHTLALAGVIGSNTSGVTAKTTTIILEAATYNQASIRRTSLRHSIRTEASTRLEKFLHPQLTSIALCRAAFLLKQICKGEVSACTDTYPTKFDLNRLKLSYSRLVQLGGVKIEKSEIIKILKKLEFEIVSKAADAIEVIVPYFRTDIIYEEDLIEEILRIHGYDSIPSLLPDGATPKDIQSQLYSLEEQIRDIMIAMQFDEHITEPLTNEVASKHEPVMLQNSLTSEKQMLRTTLKNHLVMVFENYIKHRRGEARLFEIGKIYFKDNIYREKRTLGVLISYHRAGYVAIKGVLTTLASQLGKMLTKKNYYIEPINDTTWYGELSIESLFSQVDVDPMIVLTSPPKIVLQDLSLCAPIDINTEEVISNIKRLDERIFEILLGETPKKIDKDSVSLFLKVSFRKKDDSNIEKNEIASLRLLILSYLKDTYSISLSLTN